MANHSGSIEYDDSTGREVFFGHNRMCREIDVLVAFVPEASMGTAIEMWEAHKNGKIVITVSPLTHNWAVRFLSDVVYGEVAELEAAIQSGALAEQLTKLQAAKC